MCSKTGSLQMEYSAKYAKYIFPNVIMLQPHFKMDSIHFSPFNSTQNAHNDNEKESLPEILTNVLKIKKQKYNMYINIHSFCSILSEAHLEPITASSLFWYDAISLAHLILAVFLYRTSQAPLGWRGRSQISPKIFSKVQAWVLAWALKEIHKGVPKHSFVILVVGSGFCPLVADDPSHQSEVKSSLDVSVHCCVHLSLNSDYSLSSCCWKTSLQQCCHRHGEMVLARWWGVPGFLQIGRLVFRPKSSNFVPSDQRIFISHSLKIFQVTFGKLSVGSHAYITEERSGVLQNTVRVFLSQ